MELRTLDSEKDVWKTFFIVHAKTILKRAALQSRKWNEKIGKNFNVKGELFGSFVYFLFLYLSNRILWIYNQKWNISMRYLITIIYFFIEYRIFIVLIFI